MATYGNFSQFRMLNGILYDNHSDIWHMAPERLSGAINLYPVE